MRANNLPLWSALFRLCDTVEFFMVRYAQKAMRYAESHCDKFGLETSSSECEITSVHDLSVVEKSRFQRAFFRFEVVRSVFLHKPDSFGSFNVRIRFERNMQSLHTIFDMEAWEEEEVDSVWSYLYGEASALSFHATRVPAKNHQDRESQGSHSPSGRPVVIGRPGWAGDYFYLTFNEKLAWTFDVTKMWNQLRKRILTVSPMSMTAKKTRLRFRGRDKLKHEINVSRLIVTSGLSVFRTLLAKETALIVLPAQESLHRVRPVERTAAWPRVDITEHTDRLDEPNLAWKKQPVNRLRGWLRPFDGSFAISALSAKRLGHVF